jgi:hypothetical protein
MNSAAKNTITWRWAEQDFGFRFLTGSGKRAAEHYQAAKAGENDYRILTPWKAPQDRPKGWRPDLDDGVEVNIAPLARTGLLRIKNKFGAKDAED